MSNPFLSPLDNFLNDLTDYQDYALLWLRIMIGFLFAYSGGGKYLKLRKFAKENHLPLFVALGAVSFEFWGGLSVGLGVYPQIGAAAIMLIMFGSMYHHIFKWKSKYWAASGGWEYDLMWWTMCLVVLLSGGGEFTLM